jgi:hypothetical protein
MLNLKVATHTARTRTVNVPSGGLHIASVECFFLLQLSWLEN